MNDPRHKIIIQAGGRGSRLRHHTWNKPKCLVSVKGMPIIYHMFNLYNDSDFIILGDYHFEELENFLEVNKPKINFFAHKTEKKGTIAGIKEIYSSLDDEDKIIITWSDIVLSEKINFSSY